MFKLSLAVISAVVAIGTCGRLEQQYLPPHASGFGSGAGAGSFGPSSYSGGGGSGANIPIVRYENVNNGDGSYRYSYETGNGISAHENGSPRVSGPEGAAVAAEGAFSYQAPNGQTIALSYTADENGFRPTGAHLPTPPPIPEAILRSIEFNRQHPSSEGAYNGNNDGGYRY